MTHNKKLCFTVRLGKASESKEKPRWQEAVQGLNTKGTQEDLALAILGHRFVLSRQLQPDLVIIPNI